MGGTVVIVLVLVLFPAIAAMGGVAGAALIGTLLKADRDAAHEGTEHLAISEADPYRR
jgi:Na+/H+ antiporter NhaA